jgi:glycosyltransferase involved in cell wall biosynthesis
MPKISVVIITYNEEINIERCLKSVMQIADEILIVDSFSTDKTKEICQKYNSRFITHKFEGYIEQKNWAASQAKYDHILSLDADEEISEQLEKSILEVKENWKFDGYYFNRLTYYCGQWIKHTSWYPARKLRLWDRRKGIWDGVNPHDMYILRKGTRQKHLKGDLLHYSYYSIQEHIVQINKFSDIISKSYHRQGLSGTYKTILLHPTWRFIRDFVFKFGFLDGFYGFIVSINSAHEVFLKYTKLRKIVLDEQKLDPFRICFFNSSESWGGGEKWHFEMATRLAERNYDTIIVTNRKSELLSRVKKTKLRYFKIFVNNLSFLNIIKIIKLTKYLKKQRVNTIIINLSSDLKLAAVSAKLAGVKNIIYRRGSALAIKNSWLNRILLQKFVTTIIANSIETKRTILAKNDKIVDNKKIKIIYNGIDLNNLVVNEYTTILTKQNSEIFIGNASRFSEEKGHEFLIDMAKRLNDQNVNFKLLLAGKGKLEHKYKKIVESLGLTEKVIFLGFIDDMKSFNQTIDIFVLSSRYEGFGYVLVEAMAQQKPVVAFDIGSSSEIIENNECGYLIEKFDIDDLTSKVKFLIENKDIRNTMGSNGLKRVQEHFTIEKTINEVEKLVTQSIIE